MTIWAWLHIITAYVTYIVIAILFSTLIRRLAGDLKDFASRNSPRVLLDGAAANLVAMFAIILLLVFWDRQSIIALGLTFDRMDAIAAIGGLIVTFLLAVGFVGLLKQAGHIESVKAGLSVTSFTQAASMLLGLVVLLTVVLQEEVLNRGYVTLNLLPLGPGAIILISTALFVLIHFLTNRANLNQVVSWVVSGLVLIISYLLSGSIWVPVILHYVTDAANVMISILPGNSHFLRSRPCSAKANEPFSVLFTA